MNERLNKTPQPFKMFIKWSVTIYKICKTTGVTLLNNNKVNPKLAAAGWFISSIDNKMINFIFSLPLVIVVEWMQRGLWADWFLSGSGTGV